MVKEKGRSKFLFWGLYTGFQDFRDFRSDFWYIKNFKDLKYFNCFRPDFKEFRSGVRDLSDLKSGFIDFGPHFRDFIGPDLKDFRQYSWDFMSGFKVFKLAIKYFSSDFTERIAGFSGASGWISGILGRISGIRTPDSRSSWPLLGHGLVDECTEILCCLTVNVIHANHMNVQDISMDI